MKYGRKEIENRLQDEESRILFQARLDYAANGDQKAYFDVLDTLYDDWHISEELRDRTAEGGFSGIIIFGCAYGGTRIHTLLERMGYKIDCYCDNNHSGETVKGKKVLSVKEVADAYRDYLVIIGSYEWADQMYRQLVDLSFPEKNIFRPRSRMLQWMRGRQYFDVFQPVEEEVFVDAGAFDGETMLDFTDWCHGSYRRLREIEPTREMCDVIQEKARTHHLDHVEIVNQAAWDREETLYFDDDAGSASAVRAGGRVRVQGGGIDQILSDRYATYIKLDVEGSELRALQGARETILNSHPRLAVCIYHQPRDVIELPAYILGLVPDYKFYIRHYNSHMWETVMYAAID